MMKNVKSFAIENKKAAIIGTGVIGASWAALFLAAGLKVTVANPILSLAEAENIVKLAIEQAKPSLLSLGYNPKYLEESTIKQNLFFTKDVAKAVCQADFIQECAPERDSLKTELWMTIEKAAPLTAVFLSSSSSIPASVQSKKMKNPGRLIIGHPFNPPFLMPLVEVVPSPKTPKEDIQQALSFYKALGKKPIRLHKEISGFVINRLQCALFRECVYLVESGILSVKELDEAVSTSVGLRWVVDGPFLSFLLAGGNAGFKHFIEMLGPYMENVWAGQQQEKVALNEETATHLTKQIKEAYGSSSIEQYETHRNNLEVEILKALGKENDPS